MKKELSNGMIESGIKKEKIDNIFTAVNRGEVNNNDILEINGELFVVDGIKYIGKNQPEIGVKVISSTAWNYLNPNKSSRIHKENEFYRLS